MAVTHTFNYPPLPEAERRCECDYCHSVTLISEAEEHLGMLLCPDCRDEVTAAD